MADLCRTFFTFAHLKGISNYQLWELCNEVPISRSIKRRMWKCESYMLRRDPSLIAKPGKRGPPKQTWQRSIIAEAKKAGKTWSKFKSRPDPDPGSRSGWFSMLDALLPLAGHGTLIQMKEFLIIITLTLVGTSTCYIERIPNPDLGVSAGFLPYCPGVEKNSTFTRETLNRFHVRIYSLTEHGIEIQRDYPIESFFTHIVKDKLFDLKKKTVVYAEAYYDSTFDPLNRKIASLYSNMGYNVLISETLTVLSRHYPKSVRLSRAVGLKIGELLVKLVDNGLDIANLELVGMSIGAHVISHAAKHLIAVTGKKPYKLTGLDPAGPCFRNQLPDEIFSSQDAERVSAIHTNIDVFGMARAFGQVDFYVNGGEFQPGPLPDPICLAICSHIKALEYYVHMLKYPRSFIGVKCDSIQDARYFRCFGNEERNLAGPLTDFSKPGIYFLPTKLEYPYYAGEEGLIPGNQADEIYTLQVNSEDVYVA